MINNTYHIVHEGLQNNPKVREKLLNVAKSITDIANDKDRHLTDIAMSVWYQRDLLKEIGKEIFNIHQKEKKHGVVTV